MSLGGLVNVTVFVEAGDEVVTKKCTEKRSQSIFKLNTIHLFYQVFLSVAPKKNKSLNWSETKKQVKMREKI